MKGQPNVQLVQQAYQSVKNGDTQTLLNMLAQDVLWELPEMPNVPFSGTWKGRQQVGEFFRKMNEVQDVIEFKPEQFVAEGDKVIVLGHFNMRVKATGKSSVSHWVQVWTIKAGEVSHMREYVDTLAVNSAHAPGSAVYSASER